MQNVLLKPGSLVPKGRFSICHLDDKQINKTSVGLTDHLFRLSDEVTLCMSSWIF